MQRVKQTFRVGHVCIEFAIVLYRICDCSRLNQTDRDKVGERESERVRNKHLQDLRLLSIQLDRSRQNWRESKHLYKIQLLSIKLDRQIQNWRERQRERERERDRELEKNIYRICDCSRFNQTDRYKIGDREIEKQKQTFIYDSTALD